MMGLLTDIDIQQKLAAPKKSDAILLRFEYAKIFGMRY